MRLWFGLFGAPLAWTAQHVTGVALTGYACSTHAPGLALDAWTIAISAAAAVVAVLAGLCALATHRGTRNAGDEPPAARVRFLSVLGIAVAPLFLAMILMSGIGVTFLGCRQG